MDQRKQRWLERRGYKPITIEIIREWLGDLWVTNSMLAAEREIDALNKFTHYNRYRKTIILYSEDYFANTCLEELKRKHLRNIKWFVIDELWPIKQIRGWWFRRKAPAYFRK